jgi:hypothetical protein
VKETAMQAGCKEFRVMMQAAIDGDLEAGERARLDGHLSACGDCAARMASMELTAAALRAMPVPQPGPGFAAAVVRKARLAKQAQARRQRVFAWAMAAAITVASAAALGAWARVLRPALWEALAGVPHALARVPALLDPLGRAMAATARAFLPLGGAAASLTWEMLAALFPVYVLALGAMVLLALASRTRRAAARMPVLSL